MKYIAWTCNALLMQTEQGIFIWTHSSHPLGHIFRKATERELWEIKWHEIGEV